MSEDLARHLVEVLELFVQGHSPKAIATKLTKSRHSINTYISRLKEYFENEPELQGGSYSSATGLLLVGKRYLEERDPPEVHDVAHADRMAQRLIELRRGAIQHLAIQDADDLAAWLWTKNSGNTTKASLKRFREIQADALFQQGLALTETRPSEEAWKVKRVVEQLRLIAKEIENEHVAGLADWLTGLCYYHLKQYDKSIKFFDRGIGLIQKPYDQLGMLRTLLLDFAYLYRAAPPHKKEMYLTQFAQTETKIRNLMTGGSFLDVELPRICIVQTGLARAQGLLGRDTALEVFTEAETMCTTLEKRGLSTPLRRIQLLSSKVEIIPIVAPTDKDLLEKTGNTGLALCTQFSSLKYEAEIKAALQQHLF